MSWAWAILFLLITIRFRIPTRPVYIMSSARDRVHILYIGRHVGGYTECVFLIGEFLLFSSYNSAIIKCLYSLFTLWAANLLSAYSTSRHFFMSFGVLLSIVIVIYYFCTVAAAVLQFIIFCVLGLYTRYSLNARLPMRCQRLVNVFFLDAQSPHFTFIRLFSCRIRKPAWKISLEKHRYEIINNNHM